MTLITHEYRGARGDHRSPSEIFDAPKISANEINESISEIVDATFEKLEPQIQRYGRDPRRISENGGIGLHSSLGVLKGSDRRYGEMEIKITNSNSYRDALGTILNDFSFSDRMYRGGSISHAEYLMNNDRREGKFNFKDRYQPLGFAMLLLVKRERYRENTYPDSLQREDFELEFGKPLSPLFGERQSMGTKIIGQFNDSLSPGRPTIWTVGQILSTRFDEEKSQNTYESTLDGVVDSRDVLFKFTPRIREHSIGSQRDLAFMQRIFSLAKDMRPRIEPIDRYVASTTYTTEVLGRFFQSQEPAVSISNA
jgi:hypothetical protein